MLWWSESIQTTYPPSAVFKNGIAITDSELFRFVRIILTEGIPHACAAFPMAYEFARGRAANLLGIDPKYLSLVGSARLGYSLAEQKFGQPFDLANSDIDLFAVSDELFGLLVSEHQQFMEMWQSGKLQPKHHLQQTFWNDYLDKDPNNIRRGFLDASHVPTLDHFPISQRIGEAAFKFHANLENLTKQKVGKRASIRIYRDWDSAVRQMTFTLKGNLERMGIPLAS